MKKETRHNCIIIAMLAMATVLITFFLPNKSFRGLVYEKGRPWGHESLTAQVQFDVYLDADSEKVVKDSIIRNFQGIYRKDYTTQNQLITALSREMNQHPDISHSTQRVIVNAVATLFEKGIVDNNTYDKILDGKLQALRMREGDRVAKVPTGEMKSERDAYTYLDTTLSSPIVHEAVKSINVYNYLRANIIYDKEESEKLLSGDLQQALAAIGTVQVGERIINQGEIVTPEKYMALKAYERIMEDTAGKKSTFSEGLLGKLLLVASMLVIFAVFLRIIRPKTYNNLRLTTFLIIFSTLFVVMVEIVVTYRPAYIYLIPFTLLPIIITTFADSRTALFLHLLVTIICSMAIDNQADFMIMQFVAGNIAIVAIQELSKRSQLFRCAVLIFLSYCLIYSILQLIHTETFSSLLSETNLTIFLKFALSAAVLSFAYILIFLIEKLFGFTSTVTLVELSDINTPVLRDLSTRCPGTFQHSLQVANLAGEVAHAIGANVQLVRAGALYHDIGKINNPAFFTENQMGVSPHDALSPEQSARIIIAHVTDGLKLASKAKLPQAIKDFIAQHHGKGVTKYFYTMACKANGGEAVDSAPFTYPGPNPLSKEVAIVMMADACEAAVKSLKVVDEHIITNKVEEIINSLVTNGLLADAPISFKHIGIVKHVMSQRLRTFYHLRVEYPEEIIAAKTTTNHKIDN